MYAFVSLSSPCYAFGVITLLNLARCAVQNIKAVATQETKPLLFRPPSHSQARRLLTITTLYLFPFLFRPSCTGPGLEGQNFFEGLSSK